MSFRDWFRPPRHLIGLFLLVTLVPSILLMVFGWRLLQQDRELERQHEARRREQAADLIVAGLEQSLAAVEQALRRETNLAALAPTDDSVAVVFRAGGIAAFPHGRLLYQPIVSAGPGGQHFARGEDIEYREQKPELAATWFLRLTASSDPAIRAGALIRLARNQRKSGAYQAALDAYGRAAGIQGTLIGDVPVDLFARAARCDLLSQLKRTRQLREEAREFRRLLLAGRWQVTRAVFDLHLAQSADWSGDREPPSAGALGLASAVERVWSQWERNGAVAVARRQVLAAGGSQFTALSHADGDRLVVFVGGPVFLEDQWLSKVAPLEARDRVHVEVREAGFRDAGADTSRRGASDTGLPWTVVVRGDAEADGSTLTGRRTVWLGGLAILAGLVISGTYVVGRAVSREHAVLRLQSDFVAAVSHEFRTPLTSLRQMSEMLLDRPESPMERRQSYYRALQRQTERLHRLVESLLDFGRMEAGTSPYRLQANEAGGLIRRVVEEFQVHPASRGHQVNLRVIDAGWISVDRDALTNALWNLLDNAAKYSPDASTIDVEVTVDSRRLAIRVRDEGFGIPVHEQREIFRKFVRGERPKSEGIKGTGIGLAMVRHIVDAHGGTVSMESVPAGGSTFTIRLPLAPQLEPEGTTA
jgi:signal transduction histidine kinase